MYLGKQFHNSYKVLKLREHNFCYVLAKVIAQAMRILIA